MIQSFFHVKQNFDSSDFHFKMNNVEFRAEHGHKYEFL